tara:strand:+ start:245 stop:868 length:624 start_codon:yes stop_codon:yes gene_type:complete
VKSKLKAILKMNLSDRQRRILIAEDVLGIYGVEHISAVTGISMNHVYAELKAMKESQVRSTYLVLTEDDIKPKDLHVDNTETVTNAHVDNKPQLGIKSKRSYKFNDDYIDIYSKYPKQVDKQRGDKNYRKLVKEGYTKSFLLQCVENYLNSGDKTKVRDRDVDYIKSLANFFGTDQVFLEYKETSTSLRPPPEPFIDEDNSISNLLV